MSAEPDWDQIERSNGSVLCGRFLIHKKCSRPSCQWEHSNPKPDQPRPLCYKNIYRKGGCTEGEYCLLSHEKPGGMGISQKSTDSLSSDLIKEAQPNNRRDPEPSSQVNQPPRTGVLPRVGNGNDIRTNPRANHSSSYNGTIRPRQDQIQQNGAIVGSAGDNVRFEGYRVSGARSVVDMPSSFQGGGVPLRFSSLNSHNGSPQGGHPTKSYNAQYGGSINFTPTNDRNGSASHGFISHHQKPFVSRDYQARPTNGQQNHLPWNSSRSSRDGSVVSRGLNHDSSSGYGNKPSGKFQQTRIEDIGAAQFPTDTRSTLNGQIRVMSYDQKLSTSAGWQHDPQFGKAHRSNGMSGSTKNIYHSNVSQMHNEVNHRIWRNFNDASSVPPGSSSSGAKAPESSTENGSSDFGSIQEFSEPLKGGGVALNNPPRIGYATKNGKSLGAYETPATSSPRLVERDAGPNGVGSAKISEYSSPGSSTSATSNIRNGISGGDVITKIFTKALRSGGSRMATRSEPRPPGGVGPKPMEDGGRLTEKNRVGNSDLRGIPEESMGGQLTANQRMSAAASVGIALEKANDLGLNEVEDIEEGANIGDTEHEEGGAKLLVGQNTQLELSCSHTNAGLVESNQPVSNSVANLSRGTQPPAGPKIWRQGNNSPRQNQHSPNNRVQEDHNRSNYAGNSKGGDNFGQSPRWGTHNTNRSRPEFTPLHVPVMRKSRSPNELIVRQFQSVYGHGVTSIPKDIAPVNSQLTTRNVLSNTSSLPSPIQERSQEPQPQREITFANQGRDSILLRPDRRQEIPRTSVFHPKSKIYSPFEDKLDTMLKYETSGSPLNSQETTDDFRPNVYNLDPETEPNRAYTPEPEIEPDSTSYFSEPESDLVTSRLYHEQKRVEAKVSSVGQGVWGGTTPPNRRGSAEVGNLKGAPAIKGDEDTQGKCLALAARLQTPGQFSKKPLPAEQPFEKEVPPAVEKPPQKTVLPAAEQFLKKENRSVVKEPPKTVTPAAEQSPKKENQAVVKEPPKTVTPAAEKSPKKENRAVVKEPPKTVTPAAEKSSKKENRTVVKEPPKRTAPLIPEQFLKNETRTTMGEPLKKTAPPVVERFFDKETWVAVKNPPKKTTPLMAEKPSEKVLSAWKTLLVKTASPNPSQDVCWLCKIHHQRDGECKANPKVVGAAKSGGNWASTIDSSNDWGYHGNGHVNGWSDEDSGVAISEPKKQNPAKPKRASKEPRIAKDSQSQDKGGVGEETTGPAKIASKGHRKKKERESKESRTNRNVERVQPSSKDPAGVSKIDGPRSMMFKADGNHFGRYYNTKLSGIRKLSEDTLHMIFSFVADGLMPEEQMKMKNVHIGSNFRLDANFTTTRYRRLKSVILSCRYWRNLSQHIVYKYVNLDQFGNFKRFVHTISEDPELGRMVHAVKINIQGGASYTTHDNRPSRQELSEMPKSSDSAQLFTSMMERCPELQILSVNMYGAIRGFNFVLTKFLKMREMQIMDDSSKGMVADNLWKSLDNYPNLEKFKIFHSEENGATNFDGLRIPPKNFLSKGSSAMILKALTMERAPELSDKILGVFASRLKQLTHLVIVDCKLVTSAGLARAIQRMPNASQINRLIYYVWVDPFGKATPREMAPQKDHLCSTIRERCTGLTYLNWKPYRICGDFWKESNFRSLKRCRIEPMIFKDCSKDVELRNHSKFMDAYRQAREEERLPELAEDRAVFDFYF